MERAWIGVGSNLLDPKKQVDRAVWALSQIPKSKLIVCSTYYRSRPLGFLNQPDFLNMVVILDTKLYPEVLLNYMQQIEQKQGRIRCSSNFFSDSCRWKSRTLDLDILLFGKSIICNSKLTVPHYDMLNREFVMYPLIELDSGLIFPNGKLITDVINTVSKNGLSLWNN